MMKKNFLILLLALVVFSGVVSASFDVDSGNLTKTNYLAGEKIVGKINISLTNYNNLNFTDNFGNSISLLDALKKSGLDSGFDFFCSPGNCKKGYSTKNGLETKNLVLEGNTKKMVGWKFSGLEVDVREGFSLNIKSDLGAVCGINQIAIDLFDDGSREFVNDKYLNETCGEKNYGCFESGIPSSSSASIGSDQYCEKMTLQAAPAYRVGAKVVPSNPTQSATITFSLYDSEGDFISDCDISGANMSGEKDCIIERAIKTQDDYFVCVSADVGTYRIDIETHSPCGMRNLDPYEDFTTDYAIYTQALKYAGVNTKFDEVKFEEMNGQAFNEFIQEYLNDNYDSQCDPECVIPFSVYGLNQVVELSNLTLGYDTVGASGISSNKSYDLDEKELEISSDYIVLDLANLNFTLPAYNGSKNYEIKLGGERVLREEIDVLSSFGFSIDTSFVLVGRETEFNIVSSSNITASTWKFGDGSASVSSTGKSAKHRYSTSGSYEIEVEALKSTGEKSTKKFTVAVGDAKESANLTIQEYEKRIINVDKELNAFPTWIGNALKTKVGLETLNASLKSIKSSFNLATSDTQYLGVVNSLIALKVPKTIFVSSEGDFPIEVGFSGIQTDGIEELSVKSVTDKIALKEAIISWFGENYNATVHLKVISAEFDSGQEGLATTLKVGLVEKSQADLAYLIVNYPSAGIVYSQNYGEKSIVNGQESYIQVDGSKTVEFLVKETVGLEDLGMYVSPPIEKLSFVEGVIVGPGDTPRDFNWSRFIIWMIVLLVVVFVAYIALQEWYKRHYEDKLFPDKDSLYNLINFMFNARHRSIDDSESKKQLEKSGWTREQINYAIRKLDGKRTGMWEIPVFKFLEKKKVQGEIEKRQQDAGNVRFIKQPRF